MSEIEKYELGNVTIKISTQNIKEKRIASSVNYSSLEQ